MAETNNKNTPPDNSVNNSIADYIEAMSLDTEGTLKSIDLTLKAIAKKDGLLISQSSMKDFLEQEKRAQKKENTYSRTNGQGTKPNQFGQDQESAEDRRSRNRHKSPQKILDEATEEFEKGIKKALFGSENPIADALKGPVNDLAKRLGTDVDGLGKAVGSKLGKLAGEVFKNNPIGDRLTREMKSMGNMFSGVASDALNGLGDILDDSFDPKDFNFSDILHKGRESVRKNMQDSFGTWNDNRDDLSNMFRNMRNRRGQGAPGGQEQGGQQFSDIFQHATDLIRNMSGNPGQAAQTVANAASSAGEAGEAVETLATITDAATGAEETVTAVVEGGAAMSEAAAGAAGAAGEVGTALSTVAVGAEGTGTALAAAGTTALEAGGSIAAAGTAAAGAAAAFPVLGIAILAGIVILDKFTEAFGPAIEGFKSLSSALSNAGDRQRSQDKKNLELWKKRVKDDVTSMSRAAFDVIEDSAKKAMDTWDAVLNTVTATQGYDKAGMQTLWEGYAKRLQQEGLSQFVSSADIMTNLENVLKSGLSGQVAEEFAYIATYLNAAVPTQDFFQYASTYASVAANAAKDGKDMNSALQEANEELIDFASNLLYAGRQLAGGFSSDIQSGAKLFEESAKIALTSRTGDLSDISATLTSVSAIVSAVAPDLADGIVSAVVDAATGGNSSTITALRSMAGVGASNTVFLQELANNPQKIFGDLFTNLAKLQNMSSANYMEVAEGLSEVFGISRDAFARVDFAYLAKAVTEMDANNKALSENIDLLKSGATTSTAEQLRMAKVNEYMIEEGLAYVLDSEVGRAVQQHMWEEQLARQIEENTFAVELQGGALDFLQGIHQTVENIINFLNPFSWLKKIGNVLLTIEESAAMNADIMNTVAKTAVGKNEVAFKLLFPNNYNSSKGMLDADYVRWVTGSESSTKAVRDAMGVWAGISGQSPTFSFLNGITSSIGNVVAKSAVAARTSQVNSANSLYSYNLVSGNYGQTKANSGGIWGEDLDNAYKQDEVKKKYLNFSYTDKEGKKQTFSDQANEENKMSAEDRSTKVIDALNTSMSVYLANSDKTKDAVSDMMAVATTYFTQERHNASDARLVGDVEWLDEIKASNGKSYLTQQDILTKLNDISAANLKDEASFEDWADSTFGQKGKQGSGVEFLEEALDNYGTDLNTLRASYEEQQAKESSKQSKARELHENQFWEDMQRFATDLFPEYLREWKNYYVKHTAYTTSIRDAYDAALETSKQEAGKEEDAILKLANSLTSNDLWGNFAKEIADPTVQTNLLLSKILLIVQAIMQQNNETSVVSVPTALSALGLGVSTPSTTKKTTK